MARLFDLVRENGWPLTLSRVFGSARRNFRDSFTARKLGCPGFHTGRHPRLLGLSHMQLGPRFSSGDNLWLEAICTYAGQSFSPKITIGADCSLSDSVHIACLNRIAIGNGFLAGSGVLLSDHAHGTYRGENQSSPDILPAQRPLHFTGPIVIGNNVWLGDAVKVLAGAIIGDGAIIGAGSIVTGTIPARTIALGSPARPVRQWNEATQQWESF